MADYPKLMVLSEKFRGVSFELNRDSMSAGRNDQRDICIKDGSISSYHCDFVRRDGIYYIVDHDSTNGTRLNNVPLAPNEPAALKNSDLLQLGNIEVMFDFNDGTSVMSTRTETGIDLSATDTGLSTVKEFDNLSPFAGNERVNAARNRLLLMIGAGVGALVVVVLLVWMIVKMLTTLKG